MNFSFTYMYGPGSPPKALKHKQVSSTITGPWICTVEVIEKESLDLRGQHLFQSWHFSYHHYFHKMLRAS